MIAKKLDRSGSRVSCLRIPWSKKKINQRRKQLSTVDPIPGEEGVIGSNPYDGEKVLEKLKTPGRTGQKKTRASRGK